MISNEVKKIRPEDFEEQSKSSEIKKLFEQDQSGADKKVVATLSKKITNSSEIARKTEQEKRAKITTASSVDTGSKPSIIVVSRGAREGQTFILIHKF